MNLLCARVLVLPGIMDAPGIPGVLGPQGGYQVSWGFWCLTAPRGSADPGGLGILTDFENISKRSEAANICFSKSLCWIKFFLVSIAKGRRFLAKKIIVITKSAGLPRYFHRATISRLGYILHQMHTGSLYNRPQNILGKLWFSCRLAHGGRVQSLYFRGFCWCWQNFHFGGEGGGLGILVYY